MVAGTHSAKRQAAETCGLVVLALVWTTLEELLSISAVALHPIHLEPPDWYSTDDLEPQRAIATTRQPFSRAAAARSLVHAFHFSPFPGLGHAMRRGAGWHREPATGESGATVPRPQ